MGQKLSCGKSQVYFQISKVEHALDNDMKINSDKSKFKLFNPTKTFDFIPDCEINGKKIDTNEEIKILGLTLQNDLKWKSNTNNMTRKAYKRLWIIKRLKKAGANKEDLIDVYTKQVRSVLEFGVPVRNSGLSKEEISDIERVQKAFLHILLGKSYLNFENALQISDLDSLEHRRLALCLKFSKKASKHPEHQHWFKLQDLEVPNTRSKKPKYKQPMCRSDRFHNSPIPYMTRLLNTYQK